MIAIWPRKDPAARGRGRGRGRGRWRGRERRRRVRAALHELRGPLTAVQLAVSLSLRRGQLTDSQARAVDLELARARRALEELEEQLFDGSGRGFAGWEGWSLRIRRPGAAVRRPSRRDPSGPVDLHELLCDSCQAWRGVAQERGASIDFRWIGPPAWVLGDRVDLARVSGNLIANAIEHGGGRITVEGTLLPGPPPLVRIVVGDEGPGLPAPLAQLGRRVAGGRAECSRGWGLQIAKAIVAAHGGRLGARPAQRGARLVVELPAWPAEAAHALAGWPGGGGRAWRMRERRPRRSA